MSKKNGLADPTRLKPFDADDKQMLRVVIENSKRKSKQVCVRSGRAHL